MILSGAAGAQEWQKPPKMGLLWFARLQNPETRVAALYELEKAKLGEGETLQDAEEFAAEHEGTVMFHCPQPDLPSAWALVNTRTWRQQKEALYGPEPEDYEPHPMQTERRRQWDTELGRPGADFRLWEVGQPWLESVSGMLVDSSGNQIDGGFFANVAVPADFDGDGLLDLLEVERVSLKDSAGLETDMDCLSIGPFASDLPRQVSIYCNQRENSSGAKAWRFEVREGWRGDLQVIFVPEKYAGRKIVFSFRNGKFVNGGGALPPGIWVDHYPAEEDCEAGGRFLALQGFETDGFGSDDVFQCEAGRPCPPPFGSFDHKEWTLPETGRLNPPRAAAQAMVAHQIDRYFRSHYDLASVGEPVAIPVEGWLEHAFRPGWGDRSVAVWWLKAGIAERWIQKDTETFLMEPLPVAEVGHRMAVAHELDRVRSVARNPFAPDDGHYTYGGADHTICRVRVLTHSPVPHTTVFEECSPSLWAMTGSRYDRDLASVTATLANLYDDQVSGKPQAIRDLISQWLDPEKVAHIPPGLSRAAVYSIGKNRWKDLKPWLVKLQASFGPLTESERRVVELTRIIYEEEERGYGLESRDNVLSKRKILSAKRELRELTKQMTGDPHWELRQYVKEALDELDGKASE